MKSRHILLCAAVLCAGLTTSACSRQASDPLMDRMLHNIRQLHGRTFEGGVQVVDGRVDGKTLVVIVQVPAAAQAGYTPAQFTALLASGFCTAPNGREFFTEGRMLRLETAGAAPGAPSASIDHCPTVAETGLGTSTYAQSMQSMVGRQFGVLTLASVTAEGDVLVVTFDGPAGWREGHTGTDITNSFLTGFCRSPNSTAYFAAGRTLRVDSLEGGAGRLAGDPVSGCPASAGAAAEPPAMAPAPAPAPAEPGKPPQ